MSNPIQGVKRIFGGYSNKGNGLLNNKGSRGFVPIGGDGSIIESKTNRQNMKLGEVGLGFVGCCCNEEVEEKE